MYQIFARNAMLPLLDLCRRRNVAKYWKILERTQWLERDELIDLQQRRLRTLLHRAYDSVPYYYRIFKERGLRPGDIKTAADLKKLPILKKAQIIGANQEFVASGLSQREIVSCQTGGTTAAPLPFYRTKEDVDWGTAACFRAYGWGGYELGDRCAVVSAFRPSELRDPLSRLIRLFQRQSILLNALELSEDSIRLSVGRFEKLRPRFLIGYSSVIHLLTKYLLTEGTLTAKLKSIFTTGETILPSRRNQIEEAFSCEIYDLYGAREFSLMASECSEHAGYHIQSENVVLEFVKNREEVGPGETGQILITGLHNYAMPFIRYDIGDAGKPSADECACGRGLPLVESLEGRSYEFLETSDGSILGLRDLDTVFESLPVKDFQVAQRSRDEILVSIVTADGYSEKDSDFIKRNIAWKSEKIRVEVQRVESIPTGRSGKKHYLVNRMFDIDDQTLETRGEAPDS